MLSRYWGLPGPHDFDGCSDLPARSGECLQDTYRLASLDSSTRLSVGCYCHFSPPSMAAPRSVLIVSAAPGNTIVNIAREIANRRHFTIFACTNPARFVKPSPESTWLRIVDINPGSPASLSRSIDEVSSIIRSNGFDSLDVLVNDVGVGSPLALLDVMMDEASESYERKVSDALSLAGSCATLLHRDSGKIVNMSSAGAMVSAPCMSEFPILFVCNLNSLSLRQLRQMLSILGQAGYYGYFRANEIGGIPSSPEHRDRNDRDIAFRHKVNFESYPTGAVLLLSLKRCSFMVGLE